MTGAASHRSPAQDLLVYLHYSAPIVLLVFFLFVFTLRSVIVANNANAVDAPPPIEYGPGGKPLPRKLPVRDTSNIANYDFSRSRKLLFIWLSVAAALTLATNAGNVIFHAIIDREHGWWCGKSTVVSRSREGLNEVKLTYQSIGLHRRLLLRLYPVHYIHCGWQTLPDHRTSLYLAGSPRSGPYTPWCIRIHIFWTTPRATGQAGTREEMEKPHD